MEYEEFGRNEDKTKSTQIDSHIREAIINSPNIFTNVIETNCKADINKLIEKIG
jgi:hypothetical protein